MDHGSRAVAGDGDRGERGVSGEPVQKGAAGRPWRGADPVCQCGPGGRSYKAASLRSRVLQVMPGVGLLELRRPGLGAGGAQQALVPVDVQGPAVIGDGAPCSQLTYRLALIDRTCPAGQVTVPPSSLMAKSSRVNPPGTAGCSGMVSVITASCPAGW